MKTLFLLLFTAALLSPSKAEIYADFTVSQASNPIGTFRVQLDYEKAPRTCANFIGLVTGEHSWIDPNTGAVRNDPYYDGIIFHRLNHNFVIQGGDPLGTGGGGPGFSFEDEFDPTLRHTGRYILSMANSGPNTNGSQFFITLAAAPFLNDVHNVFGEVVGDGRSIIDDFTNSTAYPTNPATERPNEEIKIDAVKIVRTDAAAQAFDINDPALRLPKVATVETSIDQSNPATPPLLIFNQPAATTATIGLSSDLASWNINTRFSEQSSATITSWQPSIDDQPELDKHFYQISLVQWPTPSLGVGSLVGRTLTMNTNFLGTLIFTFDQEPDSGVSPAGTVAQVDGGSGTFSDYSLTPEGSSCSILVEAGSFPPFRIVLGFDTNSSGTLGGRTGGTFFNASRTPLSGTFSLTAAP